MKTFKIFLRVVFLLFINSCMLYQTSAVSQWVHMPNTGLILSMATDGQKIYTGTEMFSFFHTEFGGDILVSTNDGWNWTGINYSDRKSSVYALACKGTNVIAGTYGEGGFLSANSGLTWTQINIGFYGSVYAIAVEGDAIYAGGNSGFYRSLNNGWNWVQRGLNQTTVLSIAAGSKKIYAGTSAGIYVANISLSSWINIGLNNKNVRTVFLKDNNIYAGVGDYYGYTGGVYFSGNNGSNWSLISNGVHTGFVNSILVKDTNIFIGCDSGVFLSSNNGHSWINKNLRSSVNCLMILDNHIFAGNYRRQLSEIIDSTKKIPEFPPDPPFEFSYNYYLSQNYPNPFNPETHIIYELPTSTFVSLKVYDITGKEVAVLVNEIQNPGTYQVEFDTRLYGHGGGLSSGVYFYRLITDGYTDKKLMLLVK